MSPRAMILIALALALVALLLLLLDVPRWLPPRVQPLPLDAGHFVTATPPPPRQVGCARHAKKICDGGDVWFLDGCGQKEELVERCDDALCSAGKCVRAAGPPCESLSEGGICDGNTLRYCDHGVARAVDCGARKCGLDENGDPNCVKAVSCPDRCHGPIAETCNETGRHLIVCDGRCELFEGHARCIKPSRCNGCSCPSPSPEGEIPPLEIVAYLVTGDDDRAVDSEERARFDVEAAAQQFALAGHDTGLRFTLREVRTLKRPDWIVATPKVVREAEIDPELHRAPFAVPVVFVRELQIGERKAPGLGTFPNGACADLPVFGYHPPDGGVIFLGRLRYPTTLAHELGHYFGLCHTHQRGSRVPQLAQKSDGTILDCSACSTTGDGVCDTPIDPGVEDCELDGTTCTASCKSNATPDPNNLMSYFIPCRRYFSDEQASFLRRWARWRIEHAKM